MRNISILIAVILISFVITSCGSDQNQKKEKSESSGMIPTIEESKQSTKEVNAITQSLPTIMVMPSDALLKRIGCLTVLNNQGVAAYNRDYNKAFITNSDLKFAISAIEEEFANIGYPMENLEQQLKMITNENAMDEVESINRDLRAELMNTARPDYIVELDYELKSDTRSRNIRKSLTYVVKSLDVFTNKTVAAVSKTNLVSESSSNNVSTILKEDFSSSISDLQDGIKQHYADQLANGSEITLRISVLQNSGVELDNYCGDEEIGEQIVNWLKVNTVHSTYKMLKNTSTEIRFTNVRIFTQDENGNSYTAYDFAKDLKKGLYKSCGLDINNRTQSIGDAYLQIEGVK